MARTMTLTILADDLTGACDTGALFARRARVPATVFPQRRADGEVAVVDAESRSLPAAEARARVRAATSGPPPDLWFKKIDSTLRGNVTAEVEELIVQTAAPGALLCPAFPAQGRTVMDRRLLIDGAAVGDTALARDPDFALKTSDIVDALRATTTRAVEWCPLATLGREGPRAPAGAIVVCDAETDADLDLIVAAGMAASPAPVLVGSAGLAAALARRLGLAGPAPAIPSGLSWLIVAGSHHPATAAQLAAVRHRRVRIVTPPAATAADRHAVAAELARQARKIIETERVDLVAVTGGDTAVALYRELDSERIDLLGAPVPGVALGRLRRGHGRELTVLTKAGGFGAPDLFERLMT
jgi:uncharacterized protein YgbK (DUF1537 family)